MSKTVTATPPENFAGLMFPPDAEVGVYLLMGLLWDHLPYRLAFESFELDPKREGHAHTKYLDAKAKMFSVGEWKDVTVEFKLYSSGFLRDIERHPGLAVDVLVCWVHDAPKVKNYVGKILELESVYRNLPEDTRAQIVLNPDAVRHSSQKGDSIETVLERFSESNKSKVNFLLEQWPHITPGQAELRFKRGAQTVFRACAYSSEHLIVVGLPQKSSRREIAAQFGGEELQETVRVPLNTLTEEDLRRLVHLFR